MGLKGESEHLSRRSPSWVSALPPHFLSCTAQNSCHILDVAVDERCLQILREDYMGNQRKSLTLTYR